MRTARRAWCLVTTVAACLAVGCTTHTAPPADTPPATPPSATPTSATPPSATPTAATAPTIPAGPPLPADQLVVTLRNGPNTDLWVISAAGGEPRRRLTVSPLTDTSPALSPDRRTVVYRRYRGDDATESVVRVVGVDGSGDRELFAQQPGECDRGVLRPSWNRVHPGQLAISCPREDGSLAYLVHTDGTVVRQLDLPTRWFGDLTFSPDGERLAFWAASEGTTDEQQTGGSIWILDLTSGASRRVTRVSDTIDADPAWSPDGRTIAFRRRHDDGTRSGNFDLMSIRADGSEHAKRLADDQADEGSPSFSPDGSHIAYRSRQHVAALPDRQRVWVLDLESAHRRVLGTADNPISRYPQGRPAWTTR